MAGGTAVPAVSKQKRSGTKETLWERIAKKSRSSKASGSSAKIGLESGIGVCNLGAILVRRHWGTVSFNCEALH